MDVSKLDAAGTMMRGIKDATEVAAGQRTGWGNVRAAVDALAAKIGRKDSLSPEYQAAYEAHNVAARKYREIQDAYRSRKIGDDEFLKGKRVYEAATQEFDRAFAKEQARADTKRMDGMARHDSALDYRGFALSMTTKGEIAITADGRTTITRKTIAQVRAAIDELLAR